MTTINQKDYLKKYLAIGKAPGEKKRKRKKITSSTRVTIIDDDADANIPNNIAIEDIVLANEDAPQIVAIIDERPPSLRIDEKTKNPLWQPIGSVEIVGAQQERQMITSFKIAPKQNDSLVASRDNSPPRKRKPRESVKVEDDSPTRNIEINEEMTVVASPNLKVSSGDYTPSRPQTGDISPPRRRGRRDNDNSPPRQRTVSRNRDNSPPRRRTVKDVDSLRQRNVSRSRDSLPLQRKTGKDIDISPSRKRSKQVEEHSPRISQKDHNKSRDDNDKKIEKTLDGKAAGLQRADELIEETKKFEKRENSMFRNLSKEVSGENATTIVRDRKTGKKRNLDEEQQREQEKLEKEEKSKEKYSRWGRGVVQVESRDQQIREELYEMSKPLARYADDEDLEKYLKQQEREGDPMLAYIRKKKRKEAADEGKVEKPQFEGQFMPNRYGVRPGHRWDGVDRSNGYEKKWFDVQNTKRAQQEDSYKWSTEDM